MSWESDHSAQLRRALPVARLAAVAGAITALALVMAAAGASASPPPSSFKFCGLTTTDHRLPDGGTYSSLQAGGTTCKRAKKVARAASGHHGHKYSHAGFACKGQYHHGDVLAGGVSYYSYICKHKQSAEIFFEYVPRS
jgi:hypothetical protein